MSVRRYYLHKRLASRLLCDGLDPVWQAKQEAESGTPLPADFPLRVQLAKAGYTTTEDLRGATASELWRGAGVIARDATTVLRALEKL